MKPDLLKFLLAICLLAAGAKPIWAAPHFKIVQKKGTDVIQVSVTESGQHELEIDDASGFRTPVATRRFRGSRLEFHANDAGLIPGVRYHARLDGGSSIQDLRLVFSAFTEPEANCKILRHTWEETGRLTTGVAFSGLRWDEGSRGWVIIPNSHLSGTSIYYAELFLLPAIDAASACNDLQTMDEIAQYYILMLQRTETIGALLRRPNVAPLTRERMAAADSSARTFAVPFDDKIGDGELFNVQWLYPSAKLLRLISLLPGEQRSPAMKTFASQYTKFIVNDQLDRYLVQQRLPAPGGGHPVGRIEHWSLVMRGLKGETPWDTWMSDIDLWLLSSAAEVSGAHANDPVLAPLDGNQLAMLHSALQTGIRFFQSERTDDPETRNFKGERVGSASYFNGDYTTHSEYDYSAVTTEQFPTGQKRVLKNASWDTSHVARLPVFLRALYENRKATGSDFPRYRDLQLVANQYVYRVFNGDFSHPLFHNYFDGSDGWHRVGYIGPGWGYPPSAYCDMHNSNRPCMTPGKIMSWGLLAFANPDLAAVEQALVKLALDPSPEARRFRDRYYFYGETAYEVLGAPGKQTYGTALYFVIADSAQMIANNEETTVTRAGLH